MLSIPPEPAIASSARSQRNWPAAKPIRDALDYANVAASICVQRMGAAPSMPTAEEVETARRPGEARDDGDN